MPASFLTSMLRIEHLFVYLHVSLCKFAQNKYQLHLTDEVKMSHLNKECWQRQESQPPERSKTSPGILSHKIWHLKIACDPKRQKFANSMISNYFPLLKPNS